MEQQHPSGVSDCSPSTSSEEQQNLARAGKSKGAVPDDYLGDSISKESDGEREDGSGVSDYSPRNRGPATTSGYFDSDEEGLYSPTSPRYSPPGSCHALSDYSLGEEDQDGASENPLRKARRAEKRQGLPELDTTAAFEARGLQSRHKRDGKDGFRGGLTGTRLTTSTNTASHGVQPLAANAGENKSFHEDLDPPNDHPLGAQPEGGTSRRFGLPDFPHQGRNNTKQQKPMRSIPSADFVQFLIIQNQSLSARLEKVETALASMQSQTGLHDKLETSVTGDEHAPHQHMRVDTFNIETEQTESVLQRERPRLAWDICTTVFVVVAIIVLLKVPRLLDAVIGLVDQKTNNLRFKQSANYNAGQ